MLNQTTQIGNLVTDPEVKTVKDGKKRTVYSLEVKRMYGKNGESDTFKVISGGKQGENDAKHLQSGALVAVVGRIEFHDYTDRAGIERTATYLMADNVRYLAKGGHDEDQ